MSEISKAYEPGQVETQWYAAWLGNHCFRGEVSPEKEAYSVVIPPPNVTGVLTMGHVLNNTIQDIFVRRARQQGREVMWLPGTDHAGIATQTRVERELRQTEEKTRHDVGREIFLEKVWEWKEKHGGIIIEQLKKLGCSCDWEREVFTMDAGYSRRVQDAFVRLFREGLIYRGKRMVNWCPASLTALSDEEVIMKPQQSLLYLMRYELVDRPGEFLEISTTRPETLMGDSGVAVHPEDPRYAHLVGKSVWRPFPKKAIPIVADAHIDPEFGTGVLKVTPAHDKADFEIGQRHGLEIIDVFNPDGTLNENAGEEFIGMDRFEARKVAARKLKEMGLLLKEEPYENNVGFSERADVPIEPRISEQWFLKYPNVDEAKQVVRDGLIRFYPNRWVKTYLHWLDNIQDWCISRQLWWGHRIPVWYRKGKDRSVPENWYVDLDAPPDPENWEQEEDVLDTWASSWLWPFATMGWPDREEEKKQGLDYFYPTSLLVTGPDIIFFWVARMIMAGLHFMRPGESPERRIPFRNVYFTGIIRDIHGKKMSKSLGNSPDPLDLIEKYGADGLRFGIMLIAPQGQDIRFSEDRVETGRNFCNKLWNACRFRQMSGAAGEKESLESIVTRMSPSCFDRDDHSILLHLLEVTTTVEDAFTGHEINTASQKLFSYFWSDFCDWYVEVSKTRSGNHEAWENGLAIQDFVLRQTLLLLHPFIPFITEELWHLLGFGKQGEFIQDVSLPAAADLRGALSERGAVIDKDAARETQQLKDFVSRARALKADYNLANRNDLTFFLLAKEEQQRCGEENLAKLKSMIGADSIRFEKAGEMAPAAVTPLGTLYLSLAGAIDIEAERARLSKELEKLNGQVRAGENKLKNEAFVSKAPPEIVEGAKKQMENTRKKRDEVSKLFEVLQER
ncbi:MAG: valine--tRNA ligase [Opitutales bacterium]